MLAGVVHAPIGTREGASCRDTPPSTLRVHADLDTLLARSKRQQRLPTAVEVSAHVPHIVDPYVRGLLVRRMRERAHAQLT